MCIHLTADLLSYITIGGIWPRNLMDTIKEILRWEQPDPAKPQFMFEMIKRAATKNYLVLGKYGFDFDRAIRAQVNSPVA